VDRVALAGTTLAHMHLNPLLTAEHRAHEWAIMEFLTRLFASNLARRRRALAQA
jgi:hypothetical protein